MPEFDLSALRSPFPLLGCLHVRCEGQRSQKGIASTRVTERHGRAGAWRRLVAAAGAIVFAVALTLSAGTGRASAACETPAPSASVDPSATPCVDPSPESSAPATVELAPADRDRLDGLTYGTVLGLGLSVALLSALVIQGMRR